MTEKLAIVLFDGNCGICHSSVRFIARRDKHKYFFFAALRSSAGKTLLDQAGVRGDNSTLVLVMDHEVFFRSDAVLRIAIQLHGAWPLLRVFRIIPRAIRDRLYNLFARHRHRWQRQPSACSVDDAALRSRFVIGGLPDPNDS